MARVGFLGTGQIAAAMVAGLAGQGHRIRVSQRNAAMAARLAATWPGVTIAPNDQVVAGSDIIILCLLAPEARTALPGLPWRNDQAVISVMVDLPLAKLTPLVAPATRIAIAIPLPAIATGGCPLPVFPDSPALRALYGAANRVLPQTSEAALSAHFIATALASVVLSQARAGAEWLAARTGDAQGAEAYVAAMLATALRDAGSGGLSAALDALATEGGLNITLRRRIEAAGVLSTLTQAMDALAPRLGLPPV